MKDEPARRGTVTPHVGKRPSDIRFVSVFRGSVARSGGESHALKTTRHCNHTVAVQMRVITLLMEMVRVSC
jgi:hypothetical protein